VSSSNRRASPDGNTLVLKGGHDVERDSQQTRVGFPARFEQPHGAVMPQLPPNSHERQPANDEPAAYGCTCGYQRENKRAHGLAGDHRDHEPAYQPPAQSAALVAPYASMVPWYGSPILSTSSAMQ
jgi:hypothetical protein